MDKSGGRLSRQLCEDLRRTGTQWKVPPGPSEYRVPRSLGAVNPVQELRLENAVQAHAPAWKMGSSTRMRMYHTLGGMGHSTPAQFPRRPTPRNLVPGPGRYFQDGDGGLSEFSDLKRPQGRQAV